MVDSAELSGVAIVGAGSFNPAIFHPMWLAENELIPENEAEHALTELIVTPELTAFTADWLTVQITTNQAVFSTVEEGREVDLRDLVTGVFELLPHTPVNAVGVNADAHYSLPSEIAWHEIGDTFLPKDRWEPLFTGDEWLKRDGDKSVGLRTMTVEVWRENKTDFVRVEVAPSLRASPNGVYVGINAHFQLSVGDVRGTAHAAARKVVEEWDNTRVLEQRLQGGLMEWAPNE